MTVVVIGAGHGGVQAAASLRDLGYEERIVLLDGQQHLPYQRPPLSKEFLGGDTGLPPVSEPLRAAEFFEKHRIDLELSATATSVSTVDKQVHLVGGGTLDYTYLILATGATNRSLDLPGCDLDGVVELRTLRHATTLRERLRVARRIVIVGAGFVGLEVAAAAALNASVTVVEPQKRVLARAVAPAVSDAVLRAHVRAGTSVLLNAGVEAFSGDGGQVQGVLLTDGAVLPADLVVVAVGVSPNDRLASESGIRVDNGILVDQWLRTSEPDVFAIGDCVARLEDGSAKPRRLECVQNAVDQARHAAASIVNGGGEPYRRVPYFWTTQLGLRIQTVGLGSTDDEFVQLGEYESDRFSVCRFRQDRLVAVESVNRPRDHMAARRILDEGRSLTVAEARRPGFDLKEHALDRGPDAS